MAKQPSKTPAPRWNIVKLISDMVDKGWDVQTFAREAGLSPMTAHRFLDGRVQTVKTAKKLADALKRPVRRYVLKVA